MICERNLEKQTRKNTECCKHSLVDDSDGCSEAWNADFNVDSKYCVYELSDGDEDFIGSYIRESVCIAL